MMAEKSKVETEDIPKILVAIQAAIESKKQWTLTVKGADNGGIVDIRLVQEKSYK
jgi:hypothetical protein